MDVVFNIIPLIVIPTVLLAFSYFYFGGKKLNPAEEGLTPIFQEQCGGRFDGFNLTIPFVRHAIYENFLVVAYGKSCHIVRFDEIDKVEVKNFIISTGLFFHRKHKKAPYQFIVWSKSPHEVAKILKAKNVQVA